METIKNNFKVLPESLNKNGFCYILLQRGKNKAIYTQHYKNVLLSHEVFIIRTRGTRFSPLLNKTLEPSERFPSNDDFGKTAWSIRNYDAAIKKYQEL
jgi:hypothetical protein